ncbi:EamA family transporter [Actinoplanes sp. NBRC 103695]|uniref:DMT family transporter n=1 Tax=Actinoplanes sp. NBRC 103695 TaxID=3032202 RepID=UPI0024A0A80D|nr:EamA family transporter [Actinoplanes sp. NBRC 103695]GLY98576.1 membrane protein [Actinoplanes sp. NBRC 103695]
MSSFPIAVAGVLWGTTGIVVQLIRESTGLSPVAIGFYRLAIAAAALLLVMRPAFSVLRTRWRPLLVIGVGLGAYQALYFVAVVWGGVTVATVVSLGLAPVLIAGWEAVRSRRRPSRASLVSIAAAIAGLALICGSPGAAPRPLLGLLAALASGLGYAITTVIGRTAGERVEPLTLATVSTTVGAATLLPLALASGVALPFPSAAAGQLAYLGVVTTAVAYALFYLGLRSTAGSAAVIVTLLEPLTAAVLAVAVLGEQISLPVAAGGFLLLSAVVIASTSPRRFGRAD